MTLKDTSLLRSQCYVGGQWVNADSSETFDILNPATGEVVSTVPRFGADETRRAIERANAALPGWRAKTAKERSVILKKWHALILENLEDLALLITMEQGKPLSESQGEIAYASKFIEWFAEEAKRVYGDIIPSDEHDKRIMVIKQPIGVVGAITPWNFPAAMITRKCSPALAAGCTIVVKPDENTPLTAFALAELGERAGFPPGVINIVTGNPVAVGGALTSNPIVRKISFTGSTAVGKLLMEQCASTVKKVSLELGGNAPFIIFDDADIEQAVDGLMKSKFRNMGQTCVCANRIFVQDGIYDAFAKALVSEVEKLQLGPGLNEGVQQGPMINMQAVEKVEAHIADALDKGARIECGGGRHELGGTYFQPTVLTGMNADMRSMREEIFGPMAPLFRFREEDEVIAMANNTQFGLAAYCYTRDLGRFFRVSEGLEYGIVGINTGMISNEMSPFGGVKESGIGREGSRYGIEDFVEIKYINVGGI